MKLLVTGGAGFIGSHLVLSLLNEKHDIVVIDKEVEKKSLYETQVKDRAILKIGDIADFSFVSSIIQKERPEYIFHLAAETIVERAYKHPYETMQTNIMGTVSILEATRQNQFIKGIIAASSDKAYGKTKEAYTEESPLKGDHPYDVSKSSMDLICQTYFKTYETPVIIARFGNVYGEGDMHLNRIIPGICESVIKSTPLEIRSDGKYVRDYLYVKDVVDGYIFLLRNFKKVIGEAFNFSSQDTFSVLDLVKKSEEILGLEIPYFILNTAQNEIPYQHLHDAKIRKIGWKPRYDLASTLKAIVEWYKLVI